MKSTWTYRALVVVVLLAASVHRVLAQSSTHHQDVRIPLLNPDGGSFYGDLDVPGYRVQLVYPPGGPATLADITQLRSDAVFPPNLHEVRLNLAFELGVATPGLVFEGISTLKFTLPTSIQDGISLKLSLWHFTSATGGVVYGDTLPSVSDNGTVTFTIQNLTMPQYGAFGMTLGG